MYSKKSSWYLLVKHTLCLISVTVCSVLQSISSPSLPFIAIFYTLYAFSFHSISLLETLRMACSVLSGGSEGRRIGSELKYRKKNCMHRHVQAVSHCNALFDSQLGCRPPFYHIAGDVDCICVQLNCVLSRFAVTCAHTHTQTHMQTRQHFYTHTRKCICICIVLA